VNELPTPSYITVANEVRAEITIKRSVFMACCVPVTSKQGAMDTLARLRTEFHTAVHHCWAYRLGATGMDYRMSDDGEPSGSAGKPILFCLQRSELTNTMIVVARWFGGTKLGVGGLARAYTEATQAVLALAERLPIIETVPLAIHCGYDDVAVVTEWLEVHGLAIAPLYADSVAFEVEVPMAMVERLRADITERTHGRAGFQILHVA
jgi:uncharacterized YigZ family protein